MRDRSFRRYQERYWQNKRANVLNRSWFKDIRTYKSQFGKLRHNHFGCGCVTCKPWKNGFGTRYKPSEERKIQKDDD